MLRVLFLLSALYPNTIHNASSAIAGAMSRVLASVSSGRFISGPGTIQSGCKVSQRLLRIVSGLQGFYGSARGNHRWLIDNAHNRRLLVEIELAGSTLHALISGPHGQAFCADWVRGHLIILARGYRATCLIDHIRMLQPASTLRARLRNKHVLAANCQITRAASILWNYLMARQTMLLLVIELKGLEYLWYVGIASHGSLINYALCFEDILFVPVKPINCRLERLWNHILLQNDVYSAPPFYHFCDEQALAVVDAGVGAAILGYSLQDILGSDDSLQLWFLATNRSLRCRRNAFHVLVNELFHVHYCDWIALDDDLIRHGIIVNLAVLWMH